MELSEGHARAIEVIGRSFVAIGAAMGVNSLSETMFLPSLVGLFVWALMPTATVVKGNGNPQAKGAEKGQA